MHVCKDHEMGILVEHQPTPMMCMKNGEFELAKWKKDHPKWTITRFKCDSRDRRKLKV